MFPVRHVNNWNKDNTGHRHHTEIKETTLDGGGHDANKRIKW
jgi:hypothetical protein